MHKSAGVTQHGVNAEYALNAFYVMIGVPTAVVAADFNNDGRPDVATANSASNNVTILRNSCLP